MSTLLVEALRELLALYDANGHAAPIDEASRRDSSVREMAAWKNARDALADHEAQAGQVPVAVPGAVWGLWGEEGVCLIQRGTEDEQIKRKGGERLYRLAAPTATAAVAPEQVSVPRELFEAWRGLAFGTDWNIGTHAKHYRATVERLMREVTTIPGGLSSFAVKPPASPAPGAAQVLADERDGKA